MKHRLILASKDLSCIDELSANDITLSIKVT
jgi:hypothetical protein